MKYVEIAISALYICWLVLSICVQFKNKKINRIKNWDHFSLIPSWTFFAPRPGVYDLHLLYRDKYSDGALSYWTEIRIIEKNKYKMFWNPKKRMQKSLTDSTNSLIKLTQKKRGKTLYYSIPYLSMLNFISNIDRPYMSIGTQFCVVKTFGFEVDKGPEVLFYSKMHRIQFENSGNGCAGIL
jgi:hypothetical protein